MLEAELGASPRLVEGGGGVFDVVVDGRLVYSKHQQECGGFPDPQQLAQELKR